jgi:hypothetical protein
MHSQTLKAGLLAFALLAPCAVRAQQVTTTPVAITVTDPAGKPIARAKIFVFKPTEAADVTADELGHASLQLRSGNYDIAAYAPTFQSATVHIAIDSSKGVAAKNVSLVLQPVDHPEFSFNANSRLLRMGNGITKDGFVFSQNVYLGPDGEKVYFQTIHYNSAERVKKEFDSNLDDTVKVIERHEAKEKDGRIRSEMVVITRAGDDQKDDQKPVAMILRTFGENLYTVRSASLQDIFAVARDLIIQY